MVLFHPPVSTRSSARLLLAEHIYPAAARQLIQSRGLYLNDNVVPDVRFTMDTTHLLDGRVATIRAGKDKIILLAVTP